MVRKTRTAQCRNRRLNEISICGNEEVRISRAIWSQECWIHCLWLTIGKQAEKVLWLNTWVCLGPLTWKHGKKNIFERTNKLSFELSILSFERCSRKWPEWSCSRCSTESLGLAFAQVVVEAMQKMLLLLWTRVSSVPVHSMETVLPLWVAYRTLSIKRKLLSYVTEGWQWG